MVRSVALLNGKIVTIAPDERIAQAVLVQGDRIAAVGSDAEIRERLPQGSDIVDLGGRTVIPGMIDSHTHLEMTVNHMAHAVLVHTPPFESLEQIFNALRERAATTPKGEWIIARGTFGLERKVREGRLPTRAELDAITSDHPMVVFASFHLGVLNTRALDTMGWFHESRVPWGVSLGRAPTGELTGVVTEAWDQLPLSPWGYEALLAALRTGTVTSWVSRGFTSAHELPYTTDGIRGWQELRRAGALPIRLRFYLHHPYLVNLDEFLRSGLQAGFGDAWLSVGGIKLFADGIGMHANMHPMEDVKWTQAELDELVYKAHAAGLQIWIHVLTDTGTEMALTAYERALQRLPRQDHRHRLEHAGDRITDPRLLERMRRAGVTPITTPQFLYAWTQGSGPRLRSLIRQGFILPGNTDSTSTQPESPDPWHSIWCCVQRRTMYGEILSPEERLTPLEALRMFTLWAAWGGFEERIKGQHRARQAGRSRRARC
jgi:predicted amidohydrolase YtcJ